MNFVDHEMVYINEIISSQILRNSIRLETKKAIVFKLICIKAQKIESIII